MISNLEPLGLTTTGCISPFVVIEAPEFGVSLLDQNLAARLP
ncbi:MAG: hypothetical protein OK457_05515 [Thaumarchaeota archaeon]|nr:hypothetical protein [Nitrososphaerota archaeon]